MKLHPYKEFAIETSLSEDEAKEKLQQLFNKKSAGIYSNLFQGNKLEKMNYYGFFEGEKFKVLYNDPYVLLKTTDYNDTAKNNELLCKGYFEEKGDGSRISIVVATNRRSALHRLFSTLFILGAIVIHINYKKQIASEKYFIVLGSIICVTFLCDIFYFRKRYFKKVQQFLTQLFEGK